MVVTRPLLPRIALFPRFFFKAQACRGGAVRMSRAPRGGSCVTVAKATADALGGVASVPDVGEDVKRARRSARDRGLTQFFFLFNTCRLKKSTFFGDYDDIRTDRAFPSSNHDRGIAFYIRPDKRTVEFKGMRIACAGLIINQRVRCVSRLVFGKISCHRRENRNVAPGARRKRAPR